MIKNLNYQGFTLAEVLITLVIIGVIAALTVPSLMNKTNNQEVVSKLKKAYSTLTQATNIIISEEGTPKSSNGGWASSDTNIFNLYKKHLLNAKECAENTGCFTQGAIKYFNEGYQDLDNSDFSNLILSDGVQVSFDFVDANCNYTSFGSHGACALIKVDINGEKKPNTYGKDVFRFVITEKGLYPSGCIDNNYCGKNTQGLGCACKVLREGAINY